MNTYVVSPKEGPSLDILAEGHAEAARLFLRARGREAGVVEVRRTTGTTGKSGWFQPYTSIDGVLSSIQEPVHVTGLFKGAR